jgi:hypothetical protein
MKKAELLLADILTGVVLLVMVTVLCLAVSTCYSKVTRTTSPTEEAWIAECVTKLVPRHGAHDAKDLCFEENYRLFTMSYYK